ncbi:hypothetical protein BDW66DRAFT_74227 [Aspergillus desertorum]
MTMVCSGTDKRVAQASPTHRRRTLHPGNYEGGKSSIAQLSFTTFSNVFLICPFMLGHRICPRPDMRQREQHRRHSAVVGGRV